jgi:protein TonB
MKKFLVIILLFVCLDGFTQEKNIVKDNIDNIDNVDNVDNVYEIYEIEEMPQFPGGDIQKIKFINANIRYTPEAVTAHIQGQVLVSFYIDSLGILSDFKVVKSSYLGNYNSDSKIKVAYESLDNEALRLCKLMPNWIPGKHYGKAVNVKSVIIKIIFKI